MEVEIADQVMALFERQPTSEGILMEHVSHHLGRAGRLLRPGRRLLTEL
jgi:hypothetical protein